MGVEGGAARLLQTLSAVEAIHEEGHSISSSDRSVRTQFFFKKKKRVWHKPGTL